MLETQLALCGGEPDASNVTVDALRTSAMRLFELNEPTRADACLAAALSIVTAQLEALASEAEALRAYRTARKQLAAAHAEAMGGCVVA